MTVSTLFAAALFAAVSPAAPTTPVATASTTTVGTASTAPKVGPATRVCVRGMLTGSMIPRQECRRYADWLDDGIDPLAKRRGR